MKASRFRKVFTLVSYMATISSSFYYTWWPSGLLGALLRATGLILLIYSIIVAAHIHSMYPEKHDEPGDFPQLLTSGPYAKCRHPFYSMLILSQLAIPLAMASVTGLVVAVLLVPGWLYLTSLEEKELLSYWGEKYKEYMKKTRHRFCLVA